MEAVGAPRTSLGEYFVERGLIPQADLDQALAEQAATRRRLADILVQRGLVTGRDITLGLLAELGGGPVAAPAVTPPQPELSLVLSGFDTGGELERKQLELSDVLASASELVARAADLQTEIDALARRGREAAERRELEAWESGATTEDAEPESASTSAVYLVPRADRFDLVELDTPPPDPGEQIELEERRYVVARIGRSPLAFDRRRCVFLGEV
jgi:hypothetical protein